jgi:hypothetical protein
MDKYLLRIQLPFVHGLHPRLQWCIFSALFQLWKTGLYMVFSSYRDLGQGHHYTMLSTKHWYDFTMKNIYFVLVDMSYMLWILCEAKTLYFAYVIIWSYVLYRLQLKTYVHKLFPMSSLHLGGSLPTWYVRGSISSAKMKLQYNYNGCDHKDDEQTRRDYDDTLWR